MRRNLAKWQREVESDMVIAFAELTPDVDNMETQIAIHLINDEIAVLEDTSDEFQARAVNTIITTGHV